MFLNCFTIICWIRWPDRLTFPTNQRHSPCVPMITSTRRKNGFFLKGKIGVWNAISNGPFVTLEYSLLLPRSSTFIDDLALKILPKISTRLQDGIYVGSANSAPVSIRSGPLEYIEMWKNTELHWSIRIWNKSKWILVVLDLIEHRFWTDIHLDGHVIIHIMWPPATDHHVIIRGTLQNVYIRIYSGIFTLNALVDH